MIHLLTQLRVFVVLLPILAVGCSSSVQQVGSNVDYHELEPLFATYESASTLSKDRFDELSEQEANERNAKSFQVFYDNLEPALSEFATKPNGLSTELNADIQNWSETVTKLRSVTAGMIDAGNCEQMEDKNSEFNQLLLSKYLVNEQIAKRVGPLAPWAE